MIKKGSVESLLKRQEYFDSSSLARYMTLVDKSLNDDDLVTQSVLEVALVTYFLTIKAKEAQSKFRSRVLL